MTPLRVFIVEDDVLQGEQLAGRLHKLGYVLAGRTRSGEDALTQIAANPPDVAILDIELSQGGGIMSGIELGMYLRQDYGFPLIFLTSRHSDELRKRTKMIKPDGYLTKPASDASLSFALEKALEEASVRLIRPSDLPQPDVPQPKAEGTSYLLEDMFIKHDSIYQRLAVADIYYIEADAQYLSIYTSAVASGKLVVSTYLTNFSRQFKHPNLLRVSRSHIINVQHIEAFEDQHTVIVAGKAIPVGKTYRRTIKQRFRFLKTIR